MALVICAGVGTGCTKPDPAAECATACRKVTDCKLGRLVTALDCENACRNVKTFPECPACLAGTSASCEAISTARVCGASCRTR